MTDSTLPIAAAVRRHPLSELFSSAEGTVLLDSLIDALIVIDTAGVIARANRAACDMFGYREEELVGNNVKILMPQEIAAAHDQKIVDYLEAGEGVIIGTSREVVGLTRAGEALHLDLSVTPATIHNQKLFVGILRDNSERIEAEARARFHGKILRAVNRALASVINQGLPIREAFSTALEDLLEITGSEFGLIGEIRHEHDVPYLKTHAISNIAWNKETRDFYNANARDGLEFRNLDTLFGVTVRSGQAVIANEPIADPRRGGLPKGHPPLEKYLGVPIYSGSKLLGMAGVANRRGGYDQELIDEIRPLLNVFGTLIAAHQNNVSRINAEEKLFQTQQQLKQMATIDPITGIANRYLLVQELEVAFADSKNGGELALLFADVDQFKQINDNHGHDLGDEVLKHVSNILENAVRPLDVVGRYGGEEFLVGLPGCGLTDAVAIAERMRLTVENRPFVSAKGVAVPVSISIGVAHPSNQTRNLQELIKAADHAMYRAKAEGRNRVVVCASPDD